MLQIKKQVIDSILAHAKKDAPIEACGYLASTDDVVVVNYPLTNTDASAEHFSLDPKQQFDTVKKIRSFGMKLRAVYHSHPATPARPSQEDIRLAYDPSISYVIVSLENGQETVKSFIIKNGNVTLEELSVV